MAVLRRCRLRLLVSALLLGLASASVATVEHTDSFPLHLGGRAAGRNSPANGSAGFPDARPRYHGADQTACSDCHILNASQSDARDPGTPFAAEDAAPAGYLLKTADPLDLCLGCHDGHTSAPDVVGADANGLMRRSAGWFAEPEIQNPRGHDLGRGVAGSDLCARCHASGDRRVTCIDCHDPHGNGVARNLRWASDPGSTPDLGLFVNPAARGMSRYEAANVAYGTLDNDRLREPSSMCIDCHHVFSGAVHVDPGGDGTSDRHPTYDSERGSFNCVAQATAVGGAPRLRAGASFAGRPRMRCVIPGATSFATARSTDPNRSGVLCLTCHYAHGSSQSFALTWEMEDGSPSAGCVQCHASATELTTLPAAPAGTRGRGVRARQTATQTPSP